MIDRAFAILLAVLVVAFDVVFGVALSSLRWVDQWPVLFMVALVNVSGFGAVYGLWRGE